MVTWTFNGHFMAQLLNSCFDCQWLAKGYGMILMSCTWCLDIGFKKASAKWAFQWTSHDCQGINRQQSIQRLVGSMRRRCTACIQNNGGHTRYWKGTDFAPSAVMYWWDGLSWSKTWHVINKMPMFQLAIVGLFYFELLQFYYISNKW